jgi:hypothetical protein
MNFKAFSIAAIASVSALCAAATPAKATYVEDFANNIEKIRRMGQPSASENPSVEIFRKAVLAEAANSLERRGLSGAANGVWSWKGALSVENLNSYDAKAQQTCRYYKAEGIIMSRSDVSSAIDSQAGQNVIGKISRGMMPDRDTQNHIAGTLNASILYTSVYAFCPGQFNLN